MGTHGKSSPSGTGGWEKQPGTAAAGWILCTLGATAATVWMGKNHLSDLAQPFHLEPVKIYVLELGWMLMIMMIAGQPLSVASLLHSPLLKLGPTISQGQHESWPAPVAISHPSPFVLLVHISILFRWINPCFDKFWTGKNCLMNIPQKPAEIWDKPNTNNH